MASITHGFDRYLPYRAIVEADPHPGFVFSDGSPQIDVLDHYVALYHLKYDSFKVPGYVIYQMYEKIPLLSS